MPGGWSGLFISGKRRADSVKRLTGNKKKKLEHGRHHKRGKEITKEREKEREQKIVYITGYRLT